MFYVLFMSVTVHNDAVRRVTRFGSFLRDPN